MTRAYSLDVDGLDGISEVEDSNFSSANVENQTISSGTKTTDAGQISPFSANIWTRVATGCIGIALIAYLGLNSLPNSNSGIEAELVENIKNKQYIDRSNEFSVNSNKSTDSSPLDISSSNVANNHSISESKIEQHVANSTDGLTDASIRSAAPDMAQTETIIDVEQTKLPGNTRVPPKPADKVIDQPLATLATQLNSPAAPTSSKHVSLGSDSRKDELTIPFRFNIATLNHWSEPILKPLQEFVDRCPTTIRIVGHTCSIGPYLANRKVGQIRADSLKQILIKLGAVASRIETSSAGETQPIASNATPTGRALNRRVTVSCKIKS